MCGILGAWLPTKSIDKVRFEEAIDSLYHRGPDERGVFLENEFYLGMRRLSIIDIEKGSQPIFSEDKSKVILFNGEIYNYKELTNNLIKNGHTFKTNSDTEVIVHSLEEGNHTISKFRGMFAISYYNRKSRALTLIRDRVGVKPLYYYHKPGKFFFYASELKGIKKLANMVGEQLEINDESIFHYLSFSNIPQPLTVYKNVFALMPGHSLKFQQNTVSISNYWEYNYLPKFTGSFVEAQEEANYLIKESVKFRLRSDVPLGIFLSGGLDSSVVAYEAAQFTSGNIQTFTIGLPETPSLDETAIAQETAKRLGVRNTILPLEVNPLETLFKVCDVYDQPFSDPSAIPSLEISRLAKKYVKVVLNGDGGDEQFAGYRRYGLAKQLDYLPNFSFISPILKKLSQRRRSIIGFLERSSRVSGLNKSQQYIALTTDLLDDGEKLIHWNRGVPSISTDQLIKNDQLDKGSTLDTVMHWDRKFNLLSGLLVKMDMATSANSIEARSPFLDHNLFEFTSRLPDKFKYKGKYSKYLLRDLYRNKLSKEVTFGAKKGFEIPLEKWIKKDFLDVSLEIISRKNLKIYDYLNADFVKNALLLKAYPEKNNSSLAYSILNLSIWLDRDNF